MENKTAKFSETVVIKRKTIQNAKQYRNRNKKPIDKNTMLSPSIGVVSDRLLQVAKLHHLENCFIEMVELMNKIFDLIEKGLIYLRKVINFRLIINAIFLQVNMDHLKNASFESIFFRN